MANKTLKFVYIVILFVSFFIVVVNTTRRKGKLIIIIYFYLFYAQSFNLLVIILYSSFKNKGKCQYDRECYEYYPGAAPGSMTCFEGICCRVWIIDKPVYVHPH
jgi:ABC-type multidrug transport system permease subunit